MTSCAGSPATNVAQRLINGAMREVNFLCCFNNHVESFENKKEQLSARRIQVLKSIEDAKERDETQVDDDVQRFLNETDVIIEEDTKTRKKRFHRWCPDCIWQCRQGKKLAKKMQDIEDLIGRSYEFQRVAYHAKIPSFIDFESRKSTFEELVEALENGNYCMIGLQGLWGIGETTLAHQVGVHVEESKAFQKVIFTTVSNAPDISKIQADIARQLGLSLEERGEAEHSKILWSRIANDSGRLLIILDEVWSALNLEDIGIPSGNDHKNCCVLVTTRDVRVCRAMECQLTIHLQTLTNQDALRLFMSHASDNDLSSSDLNGVALDIVNKCGGLPVAIVEMARTLRNRPVGEWKFTLTTLRNSQPSVDTDEGLANIHKCLKLSYDNLRNEKAKKLFLLCSLFPEDYEIPISLLVRLGIGAGIFGEVDKYCEARSQALAVKNELIAASFLLEVEKGCVKMPDLVSEVARWIAKEDAQVIMNSKVTLKSNLRFLSWSADEFPNQFHGAKLEVLLLWINGYVKLEDAKAIFKEMGGLRVLVLCCGVENCFRLPLQPFLLLKNIRTFILTGWKLANISILGNMQSLETLELNYCSITELPKEIKELEKLKLLGLRGCSIERNNPFEVIERCARLEELYFVENTNVEDWEPGSNRNNIDRISQDISPPALRMYSIDCSGLEYFDGDNGLLKCFNTKYVKNLISGAMFQHLLEKAEVLELWGKEETRWRSLVPDIIPIKDGVANDLIKLCLYEWDSIEYLIDAKELLHSDATVFSKLVELHMRDVGVRELCRGHRMPSRFLERLQVLKIWRCMKLHSIYLDGSLKLPHLKVLKLEHCALLGSVFKPSDARSLAQLEELVIEGCNKLRSLIADESSGEEMADVDHQNSYVPMFLRLKTLKINACESLELVWPLLLAGDLPLLQDLSIRSCEQLRYISDEGQVLHQQTFLPSLTVIDLYRVPNLIDIFRASSLESRASRKGTEILFTAECLLRPPLGFQNIRHMKLSEFPNIRSLFSVAIAATIMLEELEISYCEELKHIITNEGDDYNHINKSSIFPKLQGLHISYCNKMEYIFPSTFSGLQKLKYMTIDGAIELKHVFGKYNHEDYSSNDNENGIDLPALEALSLKDVPNLIRICINRYHLKCPSLQKLDAPKETKMHKGAKIFKIEETPDVGYKYGLNFHNLQQITITRSSRLQTMFSTSTWRSLPQLSKLHIWECNELRNVVEDDSKDHGLIFPKLEDLGIWGCMNLEFIFPSPDSGGFQKLKYLVVREAPKVKYIFGKYLTNQNESNKVQVYLSALETLSLTKVPNMMSIFARKHNILRLPSLRNIALENCQELSARPFPNLTLYWKPAAAKDLTIVIMDQQKLMSLAVEESIIEEVFNFGVYVDYERFVNSNLESMRLKYLRELRHIFRGGKYGLSLNYLRKLEIESCRKLRAVFSASMSKSLLQLSDLSIKGCPELLHLIEEDDEENDNDDLHQQLCFPKLEYIDIERCHSLKCLFSISTFRMLPKLQILRIVDASELKQVFTCKQDDIQKMAVKDLCPTLSKVTLKRLPRLVTVCGRTNFQTVQYVKVVDCPNYEGPQNGDSENEAETEDLPSDQEMPYMGETSASPSFAETTKETLMEIEAKVSVPASEKQAIKALPVDSQLRTPSINDLEDEQTMSEPTVQLQHQDLGKEMKWREHRVIESIRGDKHKEKEVGKAVPALELTGSLKKVVLKLDLDYEKAKNKAMKMVSRFPGLMGGSSKFSTSSVPPTPRTEGEILQSSNLKNFTYNELRTATRNFRPDSMVGEGGFGGVFKGWLDEQTLAPAKPRTGIVIAVKKLNQEGCQGHNEWLTEINFLGQLHHPNLVKLIGYCLEDEHRLLVYEFLTKGSLDNHLFRRTSHFEPLSWSTRMKIALDAAKGLAFLHSDGVKVIYRDLKTSNILLDSNFNAKLSDFGLVKDGPSDDKSHVSTRVMGTYGYAAPEYIATGHLTKKSDVYTFGVVLLEIMSGKRASDRNWQAMEQNLVEWAKPYLSSKRRIFRVMDARIEGRYLVREAMKVAKITMQCLSVEPRFRPTMADVVRALEQLQDPSDAGSSTGSSSSNVPKQHKRSTNESLNGAATSEPRSSASHST